LFKENTSLIRLLALLKPQSLAYLFSESAKVSSYIGKKRRALVFSGESIKGESNEPANK
jgi:hypothetical protein